ncbi:putative late blight resistance protein homolog R1B-12 [Nicotiana tabacum]|uniref:Late blight resistance protein homolog R1B-12 n=1 Tax=Nicotiana tabacum TaxID=4097 RepID=A0AC58RTG1_TOBAC
MQSSYDHLEDHLKPYLLYMGSFLEDYRIPVSDLLKLWMGEEFVLDVVIENMEEAARVCLNDLLNRSLVMVSEKRLDDHSEYRLDKVPLLDSEETKSLEYIAHLVFNTWSRSDPLPLLAKLRLVRVLHFLDVEFPRSWATAVKSLTHLRWGYLKTSPATIRKMMKLRHVNLTEFLLLWEDSCDLVLFEESSETMLENLKTFSTCTIYEDEKNPRQLSLLEICLTEEMASNIARLRKLESLKLTKTDFLGENCWDATDVEFPALIYLSLLSRDMRGRNASEESFPMLEQLVIHGCRDLEEIPLSFADIPTLQLIEVEDCLNSIGDSAMDIKREVEETTRCDNLQVLISKKYRQLIKAEVLLSNRHYYYLYHTQEAYWKVSNGSSTS